MLLACLALLAIVHSTLQPEPHAGVLRAGSHAVEESTPHADELPRVSSELNAERLSLAPAEQQKTRGQSRPGDPDWIDPLSVDRSGDESPTIAVHVLDARTLEPVTAARMHVLRTIAFPESQDVTREGDRLIVGPSPSKQPHRRILALGVDDSGPSPLTLRRQARSNVWVTAEGYGWANWHVARGCPEIVTVLLEPANRIEVTVSGAPPGAPVSLRVRVHGENPDEPTRDLRARTTTGHAEFRDLPPGRLEIDASVSRNALAVRSAVMLRGRAVATVSAAGSQTVAIELRPDAAELRLRFLLPIEACAAQRIDLVTVERMAAGGLRTDSVALESAGTEGAFEVFVPRRLPGALPGTATVLVHPHGWRGSREVTELAPIEWDIELPALATSRVTVTDRTNGRPYRGAVHIAQRAGDPDEELGELGYWQRRTKLELNEMGEATLLVPNGEFFFSTEPQGIIVEPASTHFGGGSSVPEHLHLSVRPIAGVFYITDLGVPWRIEDLSGRRVEPVEFREPPDRFARLGRVPFSEAYFDAEGGHRLVVTSYDHDGEIVEERLPIVLERGATVHPTQEVLLPYAPRLPNNEK